MASANEDDKNPVGRPLKYKTVDELKVAVNAYFSSCDPHTQRRVVDCGINEQGETIWREREIMTEQKPYTMSGLARAIGLSRQGLLDYANRDEFIDTIEAARERCHEFAESQLYGRASSGAAFSLTNNWGWKNKSEVDHTSQGERLNPFAPLSTEELRKLAGQATPPADDAETADPQDA